MKGDRRERPEEWPDPPEEEKKEESTEKPVRNQLVDLTWEPVFQHTPDEMPVIDVWRARTDVGWIVAGFQNLGDSEIGDKHELVGFTFVPDFGSNNMTKMQWK